MNWNAKSAKKAVAGLAVARKLRDISDYDFDDALHLVGLRRRQNATARFFSGLGLVLGGVAVGTVLGLMMAPRAGKDLRKGLQQSTGMRPQQQGQQQGYGAQPMNAGNRS